MNAPQQATLPRSGTPQPVTDVDSVPVKSDTRPVIRLGFWVLIVGFGLFVAWAAFAPLDEGVVAPATVSIETRRKAVQHVTGGVVMEVMVKEGTEVKQGDVVALLDDGNARASYEVVSMNYLGQRALESRLLAEAAGLTRITFHPDLLNSKHPTAASHMSVQQQLFNARRAALSAEIQAARQAIAGIQGQIAGQMQLIETRKSQASLQAQQLSNVRMLAADGFAPRNQVLELEQAQAALQATISELQTSSQRLQSSIAETGQRIAQREQEYIKEVSTLLADVRREVGGNEERMVALATDLGRMQIRAPVAGYVLGLVVNGPGAVVTPGQRLMDIVPQGDTLLLDAHVPQPVIDRIKVGDVTEVRFSSFADAPQLVVHGKLVSLSADAVTEQSPSGGVQSYYLGRVELTPEGRKALGDRVLLPGMMAEVLIKTGERSLLTYLLHPLTKRIAASMTEV
jgi:membrane fusion protein, protease secretion system